MATDRARQILRVGQGYLSDRIRRPEAATLDEVPAFAWGITPRWMTLAICADVDAEVTEVKHETVSNGTTCRSRLHLSYRGDQEVIRGLPETVFVKSTSTLVTRLEVGATGGASGEIRFYRDVRPTIDVNAPLGYYGRADRRSGRSVLIIEDIARRPGLTFGDARRPIDRAHAEEMVDTLAGLHGSLQDSPRFGTDLSSVVTSLVLQQTLNRFVDFEARTDRGAERAADVMATSVRRRKDELHRYLMRSLELDRGRPTGLVHTDVHAGNWYSTAEGGMGLFDWAAYARGLGTRDLAYAITSALRIEDRRTWDEDLIARYADRLAKVTSTPVDTDRVWTSYRQQHFHGLAFWLSTIGRGRLNPQMQDDEISLANIERMSQAIEDLDGFDAVDNA